MQKQLVHADTGAGSQEQRVSSSAAEQQVKHTTERAVVQDAIQTARNGAAKQAVHVQFPWDEHAVLDTVRMCDDSCPAAGNGICDDGRGLPIAPSLVVEVRQLLLKLEAVQAPVVHLWTAQAITDQA